MGGQTPKLKSVPKKYVLCAVWIAVIVWSTLHVEIIDYVIGPSSLLPATQKSLTYSVPVGRGGFLLRSIYCEAALGSNLSCACT